MEKEKAEIANLVARSSAQSLYTERKWENARTRHSII